MRWPKVLPRIPKDFAVPIVVVQHMPPIFTRLLAERLAPRSAIPVQEGSAGVILRAETHGLPETFI
jgi:two-component system chemotaxis response regulator CheB